jgi:hypothetical protein
LPDNSKAQHYIPQFYLKGFTDNGKLWVLEKWNAPRASRPKNEAHRPDFYTFHDLGYRDEAAERTLCLVENEVAPIIKKIANKTTDLTAQQISSLYIFVSVMFARVPNWRTMLDSKAGELLKEMMLKKAQNKEDFNADYRRFYRQRHQTDEELMTEAEKMRALILSGQWAAEQKSVGYNLKMMFQSAFAIAETIAPRSLELLVIQPHEQSGAPEESAFLTSDSPVVTLLPEAGGKASIGIGFGCEGAEVFMSLNKRVCLRIYEGKVHQRRVLISRDMVKQINNVIMAAATRYVYSSRGERRLARLFNEYGCKIIPGKNAFVFH